MIKLENILISFYGITTVIIFITMMIMGGLFDSINTVLYREISFVISPYALKSNITIPLYSLYNIQLFMFSLVLLIRMNNTFIRAGSLYLSLSAIISMILLYFPMDPLGISQSISGATHILIIIISGIYVAAAMALFGYGFKKTKNLTLLSRYATEISLLILVIGFLIIIFAITSMPTYVGFFEKIPIAAFLFWLVLTSFAIIKSDKRIKYIHPTKRKKYYKRAYR